MQYDLEACQILGHQKQQIISICTYKRCDQISRFMCEECFRMKMHEHGSQVKVIRKEDFNNYLNFHLQPKLEEMQKEAQNIPSRIQEIYKIIQQLQNIIKYLENHQFQLEEINRVYKLTNEKLLSLNPKQMNYLINPEDRNIDHLLVQNEVQKIISQFQKLNQEIANLRYVPHLKIKANPISSPNISQNEHYLIFCYKKNHLKLSKLNSKIQMNQLNTRFASMVKFSLDSKFIFISENRTGKFRQFSIKHCFKQIFSITGIRDFLQINNNQIVFVCEQTVIFDLAQRKELMRINTNLQVTCLEFDFTNNLLVSLLDQSRISFFNRIDGNLVTQQHILMRNEIFQIKLLNQGQNLLTSDRFSLYLWQVDHQIKKLTFIKEFYFAIYHFNTVYQNQRFIIRNRNKIIIADINFNILFEIDANSYLDEYDQVESMNYIIVNYRNGLRILRKM